MVRQLGSGTRSLLTVAGWLVAVGGATTVGVLAVDAIGSGIAGTNAEPLSQREVASQLATAEPASPAATPEQTGTATGPAKALGTPGGTVVARCTGGRVSLVSWSPAQGFESDDVHKGPAPMATLKFESDNVDVLVRVTCRAGVPTAATTTQTDD